MIDELVPFIVAPSLLGGFFGVFYLIDKLKTHLNFPMVLLIAILGIAVVIGVVILFINFVNAVCPKCYRYSPKFVWSYGYTGSRKHLCEKCDPNRIKEVFRDNLSYIEELAKERKLI